MFDAIAHTIYDQVIQIQGRSVTVRRLDAIHPQISGNKFFKLKYNFLEAQAQGFQHVLTFGGAFSNHIAATAFAAHYFGFKSVGIIRGEELKDKPLNATLATAQALGMQLHFVSREEYRKKSEPEYLKQLNTQFSAHYIIPEGGTNTFAIQGCREILTPNDAEFDLICCAVGTGGTITGLIEACLPHQQVLGFSALKGDFLTQYISKQTNKKNWQITDAYCFGGYAKAPKELLAFITAFEHTHQVPLEQIYTAKMFYGLADLLHQEKISSTTRILVIHSGGLQGRIPNT